MQEISSEKLKELLVTPGHVTEKDFGAAQKKAERDGTSLSEALVDAEFITDENLGKTLADHYDLHYKSLHEANIEDSFLEYFPEVVARAQRAVVFGVTDESLKVATTKPDNFEFIALVGKKAGRHVELFYTTDRNIDEALRYYKGDLQEQLGTLIDGSGEASGEKNIVKIVDLLMIYAHDSHASDIHIEPHERDVLVRFRIDGILHEVVRYPKGLHEKIVFRLKIMSHMQTDEHAAAQDGRFDYVHETTMFDVRVSVIPVMNGENVVMRLLASGSHQYTIETLGLSDLDFQKVIRASQKPHGMILAVGPTGSGKTTVLYTVLEKLNRPEVNVMTIEDPVEYAMEGVQQTIVNTKKDLTFSTGLRSIVRQDPDIIMVGEIRDEETADIAVNAAMTGHLLLSTLHTNDAATTFPRLIEMGVEPFLIASSVNLIIALRLVRMICTHCKESYVPNKTELKLLSINPEIITLMQKVSGKEKIEGLRLYRGRGCKVCNNTGYGGRTGIFEILEMSEGIRVLVTDQSSASVIDEEAKRTGMTSLLQDGVVKALNGTTTLEEILKAANA